MASAKSTSADIDPVSSPTEVSPIALVPPPWTLTGDIYALVYWISGSQAKKFPYDIAYSPLELESQYADPTVSRPIGGMAMIQIIRYHESPVGPYDELAIVPGKFEWIKQGIDGECERGNDYKISRIYVSQKNTCFNGRANWNIPKHLARFEWEEKPDKSITVRVYPHDTTGDETEATASSTPFFQATMKPVSYTPSFPFSTAWLNMVGVSSRAVHPPLPKGRGSQGELPGTDRWRIYTPIMSGKTSSLITIDIAQWSENENAVGEHKNFWPEMGRWHIGVKMANATMVINTEGGV